MEKIKNYFINFFSDFKHKSVGYYIVFGIASAVAIIAWIAGITVSSALAFAGATAVPAVLTTLGLLIYAATFFLGHEKIGTGIVAVFSYGALIATICSVFEYYLAIIQGQGMSGGFNVFGMEGILTLVAGIILFVISAIAANVLAFIPAGKTKSAQQNNEENTEAATDEVN